MTLPILDKQRAIAAIDDSVGRFVALVRAVPDPTVPALGVWDVTDVALHFSQILQMYPAIIRGEGSPAEDHRRLPEEWQSRVRADPERDLGAIADRIERGTKDFKESLDRADWTSTVRWHGNIPSPVWALAGVPINEAEIHGLDIATATGRAWSIPSDHARQSIIAHFPWLPHFIDRSKSKDLAAVCEVRVRGGPRVYFRFADGELTITSDRGDGRVHCHLSADPVVYMLSGYGRTSRLAAAATGKVFAWGTRPWLALRIPTLFYKV